ncbi:MAG TPA: molybdate ABC transporter substrate-binding protein [Pseudoneobacillus sp.]|nr:molybdate ABC transporter substrate-binding protein [Pseudoneobacillus sp.]
MKKWLFPIIVLLFVFHNLTACSNQNSEESVSLTVSAAASMQDALTKIKEKYEKDHRKVKIYFNFGSSGALKQQITQGAPVDLFFSASESQFNELIEKNLISKNESTDLVGNDLVLIQNKTKTDLMLNGITDLKDKKVKRIAVGTPESVPAGEYTKETLEKLQLWKKLEDKIVFAKDVRQVLTYVETGNVDAGFVYKTDALVSQKVKITVVTENVNHSPIIYPVGVIKDTKYKVEAMNFYHFLQSEQALEIFKEYGFHSIKK